MDERCLRAVDIVREADLIAVRRTVRAMSMAVGFSVTDVTRIVTAASELARNIYVHAKQGRMTCAALVRPHRPGIQLVFVDDGPGIAELTDAMRPGFSTAKGLGLGLPGVKRLMDEMEVESVAGTGTMVTVRKWRSR